MGQFPHTVERPNPSTPGSRRHRPLSRSQLWYLDLVESMTETPKLLSVRPTAGMFCIRMLFQREPFSPEDLTSQPSARPLRVYLQGVLVNLLNLKIALFFLSFLPRDRSGSVGKGVGKSTFAQGFPLQFIVVDPHMLGDDLGSGGVIADDSTTNRPVV